MRYVFLIVIGGAGTAVLLWLGFWQLDRLEWKEAVLHEIEARISDAPKGLPAQPDPETDRYLPVSASGMLGEDEIHVLVSAKVFGPGYRVIRAFETGGRRVMVDLGVIPTSEKARARRAEGPLTVTGNLHWPDEIDAFTPPPDGAANIWFARDVPALAARLGTEPILIVAQSSAPPVAGIIPFPVDTSGIPNDHLGYAVTWFGMAAVWLFMTGLFVYRGRRHVV
ncbi:MAG: SURF1 family protein [Pseudomonadota bacterium]